MRMAITQVYIKVGIRFPYSYRMQIRVSEELSALFEECDVLEKRYGKDYKLTFYMSADVGIAANVIKGPGVIKRTKDIEYTIFLPYDVIVKSPDGCRSAMEHLLAGIAAILKQLGVDTSPLDGRRDAIVESICADPSTLKEPWPS